MHTHVKLELRNFPQFPYPLPEAWADLEVTNGTLVKVTPFNKSMPFSELSYKYRVTLTLPADIHSIGDDVFRDKRITVKSDSTIEHIGAGAFIGTRADTLLGLRINPHTEMGSRCFYRMRPIMLSEAIELPDRMTAKQMLHSSVLIKFYPDRVFEIAPTTNPTYHNLEAWVESAGIGYNTVVCKTDEQFQTALNVIYPNGAPDSALLDKSVLAPYFDLSKIYGAVNMLTAEFDVDDSDPTEFETQLNPSPWKFAAAYRNGRTIDELLKAART